MAATTTNTNEIRVYFLLKNSDDTDTTERYLTLPGIPGEDFPEAMEAFRTNVLTNMNQFVQPSTWRDSTGSSIDPAETTAPWTTVDVQFEYYRVTKTRYTVEDEQP